MMMISSFDVYPISIVRFVYTISNLYYIVSGTKNMSYWKSILLKVPSKEYFPHNS